MIVYDMEVFSHDWMMCALDLVKEEEITIVNDKEALERFYQEHKNDLWVGYNVIGYDQHIVKAILCGFNPKEVNDWIILKGKNGYQFSKSMNEIRLNIFDIMPRPPIGLKTLEAFMGQDIRETTVPFDINRKLTPQELDEVIFYCKHDVEQTALVLSKRMEELTSQLELVKMFDLPRSDMGKTKPQLSAKILGAERRQPREDDMNFSIPTNLKINKYKFVVDWFVSCREHAVEYAKEYGVDPALDELYSQKLECEIAGVPHIFAWGGIHGARLNYFAEGYFVNVDCASYYPSMMIEYGYHSRNIHNPQKFVEIYNRRLEYKKLKDKRANTLKIVVNSTYGAMKDRYNALYDPLMANNVCVTGQLLLLDLIEHLEPHVEIVQSNTDGILVKLNASNEREADREFEKLDDLCHEWEQRSKMVLEFDEFRKVMQKDVNNYVIVAADGSYKSKGAYVKKLSELDYDLPIINKAVVNYFVKGIPVEDTIRACKDLIEFQKVFKVSSKYLYATHNGQKLTEKTFRVFASKDENDTPLFKVKLKEAGEVAEKFANCPDHCFIDNREVVGKTISDKLDVEWYVALAKKRVNDFLGE